ncbi:HAD family hydrolase [uncultured Psychrobacter sp.]|jgi:phosphoglycolate phosphatase-like HAD superfamily hydrolase|uniref:HAD family hydrolase n=1 Tax=uncultured Psychrobacter sp. TaxID=259303 RepID=UPI00262C6E05|nr:HAD hydrolase-like protein [uncultured Psychrobacter sp.]
MRIGFDLDGTLISCQPKHCVLMTTIAKAFEVDFVATMYWQDKRAGLNNKQALINQGISGATAIAMNSTWISQIETMAWARFDAVFDHARSLLERLKHDGHTLHLVSARNHIPNARVQLNVLGMTHLFDSVDFVSLQSKKSKAFYFEKRAIHCYFGDTEADFEAAKAVGVEFYPVLTGMRDRAFFSALIPSYFINTDVVQALASMYDNLPQM